MTDGIIKGSGNSRYLKTVQDALTLYPTYESFLQALISGTLPIDLNGINSAGWTTVGTPLNKANLLSDETAAAMGLEGDPTVDGALSLLQIGVAAAGAAAIAAQVEEVFRVTLTDDTACNEVSVVLDGLYEEYKKIWILAQVVLANDVSANTNAVTGFKYGTTGNVSLTGAFMTICFSYGSSSKTAGSVIPLYGELMPYRAYDSGVKVRYRDYGSSSDSDYFMNNYLYDFGTLTLCTRYTTGSYSGSLLGTGTSIVIYGER